MAIVSIILLCLAGIAKAIMDQSSEGRFTSKSLNGKWWNKGQSFLNKWKQDWNGGRMPTTHGPWYYFGYRPKWVERFPFSSTLLVFLTDAWHLFQFFTFNLIYLAAAWYIGHDAVDRATVFAICKAAVNFPFAFVRYLVFKNKG